MSPSAGPVVVLGGYGEVGRRLARILSRRDASSVVVAGRDPFKADKVASRLAGGRPLAVDLDSDGALDQVAAAGEVVVNCSGLERADMAAEIVDTGTSFVEISASAKHLGALADLCRPAERSGARILGSVGLAPGLTTVLAAQLASQRPELEWIEITCLLGVGERAGAASKSWTLGQLGTSFEPPSGETVANFSQPRAVQLPRFGSRRAWRFDFPEQHLLAPVLGVPIVNRLCFDSRLVGEAIAIAASAAPLARSASAIGARIGSTPWAGERWAGVIEGFPRGRSYATGINQAQGTAEVVALGLRALANAKPGHYRLDQLVSGVQLADGLAATRIELQL